MIAPVTVKEKDLPARLLMIEITEYCRVSRGGPEPCLRPSSGCPSNAHEVKAEPG